MFKKKNNSKYLSLLLRHKPEEANLTIDSEGWVFLNELIKNTTLTLTSIKEIVKNNDKQRFTFDNEINPKKIRANQGHSIDVNLKLESIEPPDVLFHGTSYKNFQLIKKEGFILSMSRQHVHLSIDINTAQKVAHRHGNNIVIFMIKAKELFKTKKYIFHKSKNDVWLTEKLNFKHVTYININ